MSGPPPATARTRVAVRRMLAQVRAGTPAPERGLVLVACSGGADSVALAAATAFEAPRAGLRAGAVVIDHGWHAGSADVAAAAAHTCEHLGLSPVTVQRVACNEGDGGPEQRARQVRYRAFERVAATLRARAVLLGHHLDDQAETVLARLTRGAGTRSLAGMRPIRGPYLRPFIELRRETLRQACRETGLDFHDDPSNADPRLLRSRIRHQVFPVLIENLGPGVPAALARTAQLCAADADFLDNLAQQYFERLSPVAPAQTLMLPRADVAALPEAMRNRVMRLLAQHAGSTMPTAQQILTAAAKLQGAGRFEVDVAGGVRVCADRSNVWCVSVVAPSQNGGNGLG